MKSIGKNQICFFAFALFLSFVSGCSKSRGVLISKIWMLPEDRIETDIEAIEAIRTLQDSRIFPNTSVEDIVVNKFSVTLKDGEEIFGNSRGNSLGYMTKSGLNFGSSRSSYSEKKHRPSAVVWFKDVQKVLVQKSRYFPKPKKKRRGPILSDTYFECVIFSKDIAPLSFQSTSEVATKRVASAFSRLSSIKVSNAPELGNCGCVIDKKTAKITHLLVGSMFDVEGIVVGTKILKIDGLAIWPNLVEEKLDQLGMGGHRVSIKRPGNFFAEEIVATYFGKPPDLH